MSRKKNRILRQRRDFHPAAVLIVFLGSMFYFLQAHAGALISASVLLFCILIAWLGWRAVGRVLIGGTLFALIFVLINWVFNSSEGTPVWTFPEWSSIGGSGLGGRSLTAEALRGACEEALRLLSILALGLAAHHLLAAESLGLWLARRCPQAGLLLLIGFGALPQLCRDGEKLALAWRARHPSQENKARQCAWTHLSYWRALFALALERAEDTALALQSRGFGSGVSTYYRRLIWRWQDWVLTAGVVLCLFSLSVLF